MTAMPHSASPPSPHQPRPPSAPPLPAHLPGLLLPTERRRHGAAALLASLAHGAIIAVLVWRGAALLAGGGNGPGLRGGGGGSRAPVRFLAFPAFSAPQAFDVPAPPTVTVSEIPLPDPAALKLPPVDVPRLAVAAAPGVGAGPGTGAGGTPGTGSGTGSGSDVGPGTGGEGGYFHASPRGLILPPTCAEHRQFVVRFSVAADGHVSDVAVTPEPKDASCQRDFLERMKGYKFSPARARNGAPVPDVVPIYLTP